MPETNKAPAPTPAADRVKEDARGQFAPTQAGDDNSGLDSAEPRVLGDGGATASDWDANDTEPGTR